MQQRARVPVHCSRALALVISLSSSAWAQSSAADKAAAEALFDDGLELLKAEKYEQACKKLESSQRVDPGIGTLLYLAECYEKTGRYASAWATFREAASMAEAAGQAERAAIGRRRANRLEEKLNRLTIQLSEELEAVDGLTITHAEREISPALWGTQVPVDPGPHQLQVTAPGYQPYETTVTLEGEGTEKTIAIPPLEPAPEETSSTEPTSSADPEPAAPAAATSSAEPADAGSAARGDGQRTLGLVLGGAGVVGLGVGAVSGLIAIGKNDEALASGCGGATCSNDEGTALTDQALTAATIADVGFIAGGVLVVGGAVLYLTAPEDAAEGRVAVRPMFGGAQLTYGGSF